MDIASFIESSPLIVKPSSFSTSFRFCNSILFSAEFSLLIISSKYDSFNRVQGGFFFNNGLITKHARMLPNHPHHKDAKTETSPSILDKQEP